jgi:hypothetical protein
MLSQRHIGLLRSAVCSCGSSNLNSCLISIYRNECYVITKCLKRQGHSTIIRQYFRLPLICSDYIRNKIILFLFYCLVQTYVGNNKRKRNCMLCGLHSYQFAQMPFVKDRRRVRAECFENSCFKYLTYI